MAERRGCPRGDGPDVPTPDRVRIGPPWLLPTLEAVLLVLLIVGDPGRIDRRSRVLRWLGLLLVGVLLVEAMWATGLLIYALVVGAPRTNNADFVLLVGTLVWVSNNIAFALLYWELDGGGSAARAHHLEPHPDLAFPQQLTPEIASRAGVHGSSTASAAKTAADLGE